MSDVVPAGSMAHIRHVISAWAPAAGGKGLAVGPRSRLSIAPIHATLSVNSDTLANVQAHARYVVYIVEGSSEANYDASLGDPGDGSGMLNYAADADKHSGFAAGVDGGSAYVSRISY